MLERGSFKYLLIEIATLLPHTTALRENEPSINNATILTPVPNVMSDKLLENWSLYDRLLQP